jgi:hypothetical protein
MGKFSRQKGRRGEQELVLALRDFGFTNVRRCLNQEHEKDYRPDVIGEYGGEEYDFEHKSYTDKFKKIYQFVDPTLKSGNNAYRASIEGFGEVAISYSPFESMRLGFDTSFTQVPLDVDHKRIAALNKLRKGADFLVVKDNNKKRLYIKFWVKE